MAYTKNSLPSMTPRQIVPFDANLAFQSPAAAVTASGAIGNIIDIGPGRFDGNLVIDISALKLSAGNEQYQFFLLGSNDASVTNGTADTLAIKDFAAAAGSRLLPTICSVSDAEPPVNRVAGRYVIPFITLQGEYVFRYLRLYLVVGGTAPSVTFKSWVTVDCD